MICSGYLFEFMLTKTEVDQQIGEPCEWRTLLIGIKMK